MNTRCTSHALFCLLVLLTSSCNEPDLHFSEEALMFYPVDGEIIYTGTTYTIGWTAPLFQQVDIELYKGGDLYMEVARTLANDGLY